LGSDPTFKKEVVGDTTLAAAERALQSGHAWQATRLLAPVLRDASRRTPAAVLLAARDVGLGSCWVGFSRSWLNLPETRAMLKLPARYRVVAPIVMGFPAEWPPPHGRTPPELHWLK